MKNLKDSSEIREAVKIFNDLISQSAVVLPTRAKKVHKISRSTPKAKPSLLKEPTGAIVPEKMADSKYRGDKLENTLYAMCQRGGFQGAVVADTGGLPLAVYNSPVADEAIAAFTTVLGDALDKAGKFLEQYDADNISVDINYTEKAVLRRFHINDLPYFIMTICPQEVDERSEVELSIDQIISILGKT